LLFRSQARGAARELREGYREQMDAGLLLPPAAQGK
jgi:hypothetical protein